MTDELEMTNFLYNCWIAEEIFCISISRWFWIPRIIIVLAFMLSSHRLIIATKIVSIVLNSIDHIHKVPYFDVLSMVKHLSGAKKFVIK
jgi:hypothetical protein